MTLEHVGRNQRLLRDKLSILSRHQLAADEAGRSWLSRQDECLGMTGEVGQVEIGVQLIRGALDPDVLTEDTPPRGTPDFYYSAQKAELASGDIIRSVGGKKVEDLDEFQKLYDASTGAKDGRVLFEVIRNRGTRRAVLKVEY